MAGRVDKTLRSWIVTLGQQPGRAVVQGVGRRHHCRQWGVVAEVCCAGDESFVSRSSSKIKAFELTRARDQVLLKFIVGNLRAGKHETFGNCSFYSQLDDAINT